MKLNKCKECGSERLHYLKDIDNNILCIDCGTIHELNYYKVDKLSFFLYKREYNKELKKELGK